ncbi:MAG: site-specific DNA-methyltransferase [Ruminococcus sp.]|nr:site-specific DNA-methyltransferase [Ruminococcus sp.]
MMKTIPDNSIDLVLCDPPYGIDYQSSRKPKEQRFAKIVNDRTPFTSFISELPRIIKNDGGLIIFTRWSVQQQFIDKLTENGLKPQNVLIWDKVIHGMGDLKRSFGSRYESAIFHANKDFRFKTKRPTDIMRFARIPPNRLKHPNEKPVELLEYLINCTTCEGAFILDCCMGSGSTGVACVNTGRNFIGIELDEHYFTIAKKRIEQAHKDLGRG